MRRIVCLLTLLALAAAVEPGTSALRRIQRVVYIGTYTGEMSKGIYAFRFDDSSGELTSIGLVAETPSPSFLTASSERPLRVRGQRAADLRRRIERQRHVVRRRSGTAKLTELSVQPSKGAGPCHLILDRTGRFLAVANYGGGNYAVFPVGSDGRLQPATVVARPCGRGRGAKPLGHAVGFDAQNRFLLTADKGLNRMLVYRSDATSGGLRAEQSQRRRRCRRSPGRATSPFTRMRAGCSRSASRPRPSRHSPGTRNQAR